MSFSDLASGAACGPVNGLQALGKRFGADRSVQQDRMGAGVAGPSDARSAFRSAPRGAQQQQDDFFAAQQQQQQQQQQSFDLAPLGHALPFAAPIGPSGAHLTRPGAPDFNTVFRAPAASQQQSRAAAGSSSWAHEFQPQPQLQRAQPQQQPQQQQQGNYAHHSAQHAYQPRYGGMPGASSHMQLRAQPMHAAAPQKGTQDSLAQFDQSTWDNAFTSYDVPSSAPSTSAVQQAPEALLGPRLGPDTRPRSPTRNEMDELARTAGRLVETVDHETSAKFKSSQFLNLMSRIRDKQAGIQGRDIVDTPQPQQGSASTSSGSQTHMQTPTALDKGKARALDATPATAQQEYALHQSSLPSRLHANAQRFGQALRGGNGMGASAALRSEIEGRQELAEMWAEEDARSEAIEAEARAKAELAFSGDGGDLHARMAEDDAEAREYAKFARMRDATGIAGAQEHAREWEERMQEEAGDFVGRAWEGNKGKGVRGAQEAEWGKLQDDWEDWQAGPTGLEHAARTAAAKMRPASAARAQAYKFQRDNPYVGASTRTHALHSASGLSADLRGVLEREAAVQADPRNAEAWLELGVKQQENEREGLAIAALHKALELDPTLRDAWLALAVSYTNENDRPAALEATERWIDSLEQYAGVVAAHRASVGANATASSSASSPLERHIALIDTLIAIARHGSSASGAVDADIQVALGVLFNASEDYDKAVDCFSAALSVRPDDWLLYNRLGATLSNSGRSAEAIAYYHHALELQPGFARCHFNMSISCLNLKMYRDAASHIYTALTLQATDDAAAHMPTPDGGSAGSAGATAGVQSAALWETLRVALELLDRSDLANLTSRRDISLFDPADFFADDAEMHVEA